MVIQALPLFSSAAHAAPDSLERVWSAQEHGAIRLFGSASMSCSLTDAHCLQAQAGAPGLDHEWYDNDAYDMQWIDRDADDTTVNSTAARVRIPHGAKVLKAVLVWGGTTGGDLDRTEVRFRAPGSDDYRTLTSDASTVRDTAYQSSVDVTDEVAEAGNGNYWGADVSSTPGPGAYAGWALAIAYRDAGEPMRQLTMSVGLDAVTRKQPARLVLDHLQTPSTGEAPASVGIVAWDGDRGVTGDRLRLSGTTLSARPHARTNLAGSSVLSPATAARPRLAARANTMGLDIATLDAAGALDSGASRAVLRATTRQDDFRLGLVTTQLDVEAPQRASVAKAQTADVTEQVTTGADVSATMTGPSGAKPGDEVSYAITIANAGPDPATDAAFDLSTPVPGTSYTLDGAGYTCDGAWHCTLSGPLASGAHLDLTLRLQTDPAADDGDQVTPTVTASTSATDPAHGNDVDSVTTTLSVFSDLAMTVQKTSGKVLPGVPVTYKVTLTNHGPAPAMNPAVRVTPPPPPYASGFAASATGGGLCVPYNTSGARLCSWSNIPLGESRTMTFVATPSEGFAKGDTFGIYALADADNSVTDETATSTSVVDDIATRPTDVAVSTYISPKVQAGHKGTWNVTITNHGPHRAHGVMLVQTLPKGFTWTDAQGHVVQSRTKSSPLGDLEVGESRYLKGWFMYPTGATLTWTTKVTHTDPDSKAKNNTDRSTTTVTGQVYAVTPSSSSGTTTPVVQVSSTGTTGTTDTTDTTDATTDSTAKATSLAETGGPQRQTLLLAVALMLLGVVFTTASRQRRPGPRHRARRPLPLL